MQRSADSSSTCTAAFNASWGPYVKLNNELLDLLKAHKWIVMKLTTEDAL
jgi:hypothetical protein